MALLFHLLGQFHLVMSHGGGFAGGQCGSICSIRFDTSSNAPVTRYWLWRFDRPDDPVGIEDFWGKTEVQAVADLESHK